MAKIAQVNIEKPVALLSSLNDIWGNTTALGLSSSNTNLISVNSNNFKYVTEVTIYDIDGNERLLGTFNTVPRPYDSSPYSDGYGAISFASTLRSFLKSELINPTNINYPTPNNGNTDPNYFNSIIRYDYRYGFQYSPNLDVEAIIVNISGTDYLGFSFSQTNFFDTFSNINVISDNPSISGNFTVNEFGMSNSYFATATTFTSSMSVGTNLAIISQYTQYTAQYIAYGFDGTLDYVNYGQQDAYLFDYLIVDGSINNSPISNRETFKFLSNYPNSNSFICDYNSYGSASQIQCFGLTKRLKVNDFETLSFIADYDFLGNNSVYMWYYFYDQSYNFMGSYSQFVDQQNIPGNGTIALWKWDVPIGFQNLKIATGLPSPMDNIQYIVCWIGDEENTTYYSESRYFYIDRQCSIYQNKQLMFKNKLGAWEYFSFTQDSKKSQTFARNIYKQNLNWGNIASQGSNSIGLRGNRIISTKIEEEFTINSNWISEAEYSWLSELVSSQDVYVMEPVSTYSNDLYPIPIIITDTSFEFKTFNRDQIFNLTLNYKLANDKPSQMI